MGTVDVIVPTYNRSEFLQSAIASVLDQTFGDWTLLVVDDASTDNTPSVVNSFQREKDQIHPSCGQSRRGRCQEYRRFERKSRIRGCYARRLKR